MRDTTAGVRRGPAVRAPALTAALLTALLAAGGARAQDDPERQLEEIRQAIEERRERLDAFDREERGLFETLEEMDVAAERLARRVADARRQAAGARTELARIEAKAQETAARRDRLADAMSARAVALYKAGEVGPLRMLFSAGNVRDLLDRVRALRVLLEHDRSLLLRFREHTAALDRARAHARTVAAERDAAERLLRARIRELERERRARRKLLAQVREDRARERAVLNELEAAALALEETLAALQRAPRRDPSPPGSGFGSRRGLLPPPVAEGRIARGFGRVLDAEFRTATFRKGVDFEARAGAPVRAVADGEIRFAGWFRGYGKMVIVDHGDQYFTVSAHLGEVRRAVGARVEAGDEIGVVGDTGSLSGPLLYFEIRRGAEPLDPSEWLGSPAAS